MFELRPFEREAFLSYKEEIYGRRRELVNRYCQYLIEKRGGKKGSFPETFCDFWEPNLLPSIQQGKSN